MGKNYCFVQIELISELRISIILCLLLYLTLKKLIFLIYVQIDTIITENLHENQKNTPFFRLKISLFFFSFFAINDSIFFIFNEKSKYEKNATHCSNVPALSRIHIFKVSYLSQIKGRALSRIHTFKVPYLSQKRSGTFNILWVARGV